MKILFVFGGKQKGGAERVITNLANSMIKDNEIYFLGLKKIDNFYYTNEKIKYFYVENEKEYKKNFISRNFSRLKRIKKYIKEINPDIIISFAREQSYRILFANYFNKRKIIISVRNDPKHEYTSFVEKMVMRILYRRVDGFVFQTEDAKKFFSKRIQNRSVIIPNPINEDYIVEKPFNGKRNNHIINAGRLTEQKNQKFLINAFNEFNKKNNKYELHIYGEGELKDELIKQINDLGLGKKVFLDGNVSNLKDKIYNSKMFVLSSDYEGMPNALIEAMALGIPSISTDCPCGGPKYLIENGVNGLLVNCNDVDELSEKMFELISDEKLLNKISNNSIKISSKLDPKKINMMWMNYINEVKRGE